MKHCFTTIALVIACIGFAQVPASWQPRGIGGGGALFSPSINPANTEEVFIACDMGELFHSTASGQPWTEVSFLQLMGGHDCQVNFTKTAGLLYTIDYTNMDSASYVRSMVSTNGGATWNPLSGDPYGAYPDGGIERLFVDYNNPNHIIVGDYSSVYFSGDGGKTFNQIDASYNSNAGNHIAGAFFDNNNIYLACYDGLLYSSNGGTSFNKMAMTGMGANEKMLSFSGAREGSTVRFICLTADSNNVYSGFQYGSDYYGALVGVYTMDNANGTWVSKMSGINVGNDFPDFCGMANNDIDTMYIAGGSSAGNPIVMRATSTTNWNYVFNTTNNQNIATGWCGDGGDHHWSYAEAFFGFQVCPGNSKVVMVGDYGFAHITRDAGTTWTQQYVATTDEHAANTLTPTGKTYHSVGLENTTNWQVMWADSTHLFAGFSDIVGITSADKGSSWKFIPGLTENSTYKIVHQSGTGNLYAAVSTVHDMFQSTRIYDAQIDGGTGAVYYSTNNGTSFSLMHNFGHPVVWVALDPTNTNRMYASVLNSSTNIGGIYVTNNLSSGTSASWTKLANPPRSNGHPFNITVLNNGDLVASYCARKPTSGTSFTDSSGVYYYNYSTSTWSDRSHSGMYYWTKDVVVDPNDATQSTWYAAVFNGWGNVPQGTGGVYKTTNKGLSWTQISNSYRVNSVTVNPTNPDELYFTTETVGLWHSSNATSANPSFAQVTSYPFGGPVRVFYNPYNSNEVWVSSFGNGMMIGTTPVATGVTQPNFTTSQQSAIDVFPNPSTGMVTINCPFTATGIKICGMEGKTVYETNGNNTSYTIDLSSQGKGVYVVQALSANGVITQKLVLE